MNTDVTSLLRISLPPLPRYTYTPFRTETIGDHGECETSVGLSEKMAKSLVFLSNDRTDAGLGYTEDRTRFGSQASYESWYEKGRLPITLVQQSTGMIMAMLWFGEKLPPSSISDRFDPNTLFVTVAYRSYPPFRGTGFMTAWTSSILEQFIHANPHSTLWAEVREGNGGSLHLAKKLGFTEIEPDDTTTGTLLYRA